MKEVNKQLYKYQRDWRKGIIRQLKAKLGNYCHVCESPDAAQLAERDRLNLVIPFRRAPELEKFKNNTITIYTKILNGQLPQSIVKLLCDECKYETRIDDTRNKDID